MRLWLSTNDLSDLINPKDLSDLINQCELQAPAAACGSESVSRALGSSATSAHAAGSSLCGATSCHGTGEEAGANRPTESLVEGPVLALNGFALLRREL